MKLSETTGNQGDLSLAFGVHRSAKPAPPHIVRQIESEAQALAVSIHAFNHKLDYIAGCVGKTRSYVSRLQNGKAPIPDRLVMPLCAATGSMLLHQFRELQRALEGQSAVSRLAHELRAA